MTSRAGMRPSDVRGERVIAAMAAVTVFLALTAIDPAAHAAFDAPKRLVTMIGLAIIAAIAAVAMPLRSRRTTLARGVAIALASGLLLAVASALVSPHREVALAALAPAILFAAFFAAGAAAGRTLWVSLRNGFIAGALVNALLSLLQLSGIVHLFTYASTGGRRNISALIGNDAVLGLVMAFAIVAIAPMVRDEKTRVPALAALALLAGALAASGSFTAVGVAAVGLLVDFAGELRRRRALMAIAAGALLLVGTAVLLSRTDEVRRALRGRSVDQLLSFRLAPWTSSLMMVRDRPLAGYGPGSFPFEFTAHRIEADAAFGRRFVNARIGSYAQAHSDVLQSAAEIGLPAVLLLFGSAAAILIALARRGGAERLEIAGVLVAFALAAFTWFPMHHPAMAMLAVGAAARGWSLISREEPA